MTKAEWKKQILGIIASQIRDMVVSDPGSDHEIPSAKDEERINMAKDELMVEFFRRARIDV